MSKRVYLKDYKPSAYTIPRAEFIFELDREETIVESTLYVVKQNDEKLVLDGCDLNLLELKLNHEVLSSSEYEIGPESLSFHCDFPKEFTLHIKVKISPRKNLSAEGLYLSGDLFCTQNEAQGFRRITYFIDRPDVMTEYKVTLRGSEKFMLSNGNLLNESDLGDGRREVIWHDPFKKPSYLFALVAGDLDLVQDTYQTKSGRSILCEVYVDPGKASQAHFALESLKKSMLWDEEVYQLEYDLDRYMIVAVDSFNMGAMENKGLNIFNSTYVLADSKTATDRDFENIEGVVGHEYFHNWTGNRVTCRDWFQLTLKEGLTVFRDQEFSSDMQNRETKLIDDVSTLQTFQYPEDQGPLKHSIRPRSFVEINNFYTSTVYEKGAQVIRMLYRLVGHQAFMKGMKVYFDLYDGKAVTCEDFVDAISKGANRDLKGFLHWYDQVGPVHIRIKESYHKESKTLTLKVVQETTILDQNEKPYKENPPLMFPLRLNLHSGDQTHEYLLEVNEHDQSFRFEDVEDHYLLTSNLSYTTHAFFDEDQDNNRRFEKCMKENDGYYLYQNLKDFYVESILRPEKALRIDQITLLINEKFLTLENEGLLSYLIRLPSENEITYFMDEFNPHDCVRALKSFKDEMKERLRPLALERLNHLNQDLKRPYDFNPKDVGKRLLRSELLNFVNLDEDELWQALTSQDNMTDELAYLKACFNKSRELYSKAYDWFYQKYQNESRVLLKLWSQAARSSFFEMKDLLKIEESKEFDAHIPNHLRSLYGSIQSNFKLFHLNYETYYPYLIKAIVRIDAYNPSVASRLLKDFQFVKKIDQKYKNYLLKLIGDKIKSPSKDLLEIKNLLLS